MKTNKFIILTIIGCILALVMFTFIPSKVLFYESQYLIPFMGVVFGTGWSFIEFMKDYFFSIKSA